MIINHILPGGFMTERLQKGTEAQARIAGVADELMARRRQTIPARRYGEPEEFGNLPFSSPATMRATSPGRAS